MYHICQTVNNLVTINQRKFASGGPCRYSLIIAAFFYRNNIPSDLKQKRAHLTKHGIS